MIADIVVYLEGVIQYFGIWGVLIASFLEEVIAPLPSPVVMTASGFFLLEGDISFYFFVSLIFFIALPYALGVTLGSFILYGLFSHFGEPAVKRWGVWFGISWSKIESLKRRMESSRWDEGTLLFLRVIPIVPSAALASICGLVKMRLFNYTLVTFIGVAMRAMIFASLGWYLGETYRKYANIIGEIESVIGYSFLFAAITVFISMLIYTQARRKNVVQ